MVHVYVPWYYGIARGLNMVYVRTYNVMSQLADWKRAHMCTENCEHVGLDTNQSLHHPPEHVPTMVTPTSTYMCTVHVYSTKMVPWYTCTMVHVYHGTSTMVRTRLLVPWELAS